MLCKVRQAKHESVQVYAEQLSALANDTFTKVDKAVVESQLVGLFHWWVVPWCPMHEGHERKYKTFQTAIQSVLVEQNLWKRFYIGSNDHDHPKTRIEEPVETDHIRPQRKCFFVPQGGTFGKILSSLDQLMQ